MRIGLLVAIATVGLTPLTFTGAAAATLSLTCRDSTITFEDAAGAAAKVFYPAQDHTDQWFMYQRNVTPEGTGYTFDSGIGGYVIDVEISGDTASVEHVNHGSVFSDDRCAVARN